MTTMIALLRGVNVGGASKILMADLRRMVESCGYTGVRSYVQSGNVVFDTDERDTDVVASTLRDAVAAQSSVAPDVVVRTRDELAAVVTANPYVDRADAPTQIHVVFMPGDTRASTGDVDLDAFAPEHATAIGRELHLFLPNGMGRSRLTAALERSRRSAGTTRNWRTVTTLLEMADDLDAQRGS